MAPFGNFTYFGIMLVYLAVPTLVFALIQNKFLFRVWLVISTIIMLIAQYSTINLTYYTPDFSSLYLVAGYFGYQLALTYMYLLLSKITKSRILFIFVLVASLLPLLWIKSGYSNNILLSFAGFVGISYVTFRAIDVLLGIKDGSIKWLSPFQYFVYVLFFPTISSGPIDRFKRFTQDWQHKRTRGEFFADLDTGIHKIFIGFLYKFILGQFLVTYIFPHLTATDIKDTVGYMYTYSLYLFFDFAGYSSFAIGLSYILGIHTPENFNMPFISQNIREFWNRWHMSLSFWFRDNIYSPFVYASIKNKWFNKYTASYMGYLITMVTMGAWHGFTSYYLIYGGYHAVLLIGYDLFNRWHKTHVLPIDKYPRFSKALSIFITFNMVCFGLLIFSGKLSGQANNFVANK